MYKRVFEKKVNNKPLTFLLLSMPYGMQLDVTQVRVLRELSSWRPLKCPQIFNTNVLFK